MTEQKEQRKDLLNGWKAEDKKQIALIMLPLIEMQKAYGRELDMKIVMSGWEMLLADKYTADQICYALKEYALKNNDFPTPAGIIEILNPPIPEITRAEYIAALDWQKRNGYPMFSDALDTIEKYKKQEENKRKSYEGKTIKLRELSNNRKMLEGK